MKKLFVWFSALGIIGLMVFVLFHNKAEAEKRAKITHNASIAVDITEVRSETLQANQTKVGLIVANNEVAVTAEASGKIVEVYAGVGSYLRAGAPLFKLDNELAKANYRSAQTNYEKARKDWERALELHKQELISSSELEIARNSFLAAEAEQLSAKRQYQNTTITTPIAGVVTARPVNLGAMITPGTVVATIIDNSSFKVAVHVGSNEAFKLKVGDEVSVATDIYPDTPLVGLIRSISDQSDEARTFPVEIVIDNPKERPLKSGIYGKVTFRLGTGRPVIAIPRETVVGSVINPQVYVVENGVARLRDIVIGAEIDTKVEVLRGLSEHEQIVVNGQDNLQDQVAVEVIKQR